MGDWALGTVSVPLGDRRSDCDGRSLAVVQWRFFSRPLSDGWSEADAGVGVGECEASVSRWSTAACYDVEIDPDSVGGGGGVHAGNAISSPRLPEEDSTDPFHTLEGGRERESERQTDRQSPSRP